MARTKSFPKTIEVGLTGDGEFIIMPEPANWSFFCEKKIKKVQPYTASVTETETSFPTNASTVGGTSSVVVVGLGTGKPKSEPPKRPRKKTTKPQKPVLPSEDRDAEWTYKCNNCGCLFNEPNQTDGGKAVCPDCGSTNFEAQENE